MFTDWLFWGVIDLPVRFRIRASPGAAALMPALCRVALVVGLAAAPPWRPVPDQLRGSNLNADVPAVSEAIAVKANHYCKPLDRRIEQEAAAETPAGELANGSRPALAAALVASEVRKNARLREVVAAYWQCRRRNRAVPHGNGSIS